MLRNCKKRKKKKKKKKRHSSLKDDVLNVCLKALGHILLQYVLYHWGEKDNSH